MFPLAQCPLAINQKGRTTRQTRVADIGGNRIKVSRKVVFRLSHDLRQSLYLPNGVYYLVRVKTSITLPRAYLARLERARREARDIEIINRNADRLNAEALDVLDYQRIP